MFSYEWPKLLHFYSYKNNTKINTLSLKKKISHKNTVFSTYKNKKNYKNPINCLFTMVWLYIIVSFLDVPMIVSGHYIGILEPQEEIFEIEGRKSPGMIWHLQEDKEEIKLLADQVRVAVECCHSLSLTLSHIHTHTHTLSLSLSLSLCIFCTTVQPSVYIRIICFHFIWVVHLPHIYRILINFKQFGPCFSLHLWKKPLEKRLSERDTFQERCLDYHWEKRLLRFQIQFTQRKRL